MSELVSLQIDGVEVQVSPGTLVVDAAKRIANDIPVFCYHPKMSPVGMCRMCLVEIGLPMRDRATGETLTDDDGNVRYNFGKGLQTACTVPVSEGMVVRTETQVVDTAREDVIEFLLTSHPLDCPICDKGGECPLQNLTMRHGEGKSNFYFGDKMQLDKHVPLGDLIYLDRERCIQCARCTRFQDEVVDDPVIGFHSRGRHLEIVTLSDPGFDSHWSGNTTDICPVGALTTADFRFGARPWELTPVASLCGHCPVGCNTTLSTRQEARAGGRQVIKRIMPRQNELVNEIWICDKGRFVHHYADAPDRLTTPLIRRDGQLHPATWGEALALVAGKLQTHREAVAGLAGDRLSNEDLYLFQKLLRQGVGSPHVSLANPQLAGGDVVAQVGLAAGSNLLELGSGDALVVVATDLHEEAPVWWLRVKQAAQRGATLVVLNARPTRLDEHATHSLRYAPGDILADVRQLVNAAKVETDGEPSALQAAASAIIEADNVVAFYGREGLTYDETDTLARLLANLLRTENGAGQRHVGRVNNGLVAVWPHGNTQGAWDMGIHPSLAPGYVPAETTGMNAAEIYSAVNDGNLQALYIVGADPVGDGLLERRDRLPFLVVQELFLTETAQLADVVLPAQSWAEREGTYTNGERRVQRFYPAIPAVGESRADWQILAQIGTRLDLGKVPFAASLVFRDIARDVAPYTGMDYRSLAHVVKQWPDVGGDDLYYGGTAYDNKSGLGSQWATGEDEGVMDDVPATAVAAPGLKVVGARTLYQPGTLINETLLLTPRLTPPTVSLNPADAADLAVENGESVALRVNGTMLRVDAQVNAATPEGVAVVQGTAVPPGAHALKDFRIVPESEKVSV